MHPYVHFFSHTLPTYGLLSLVGALAAGLYCWLNNRSFPGPRLRQDDLLHILLYGLVGALVGGKLLGVLTAIPEVVGHWAVLAADWRLLLLVLWGGMVFYGGLIGGLVGVWLYCRRYKVPLAVVAAVATPAIPLFHVFGRIGCFLGGCCWGIEVPWGVVFHESIGAPNGVPLLPVQLIEAGGNLVLFVALAVLCRTLRRGWLVLPLYLVGYAATRFVLEFFRGDAARGVYLLSTSQWIALAVVLAVCGFFARRWRRGRRAAGV